MLGLGNTFTELKKAYESLSSRINQAKKKKGIDSKTAYLKTVIKETGTKRNEECLQDMWINLKKKKSIFKKY